MFCNFAAKKIVRTFLQSSSNQSSTGILTGRPLSKRIKKLADLKPSYWRRQKFKPLKIDVPRLQKSQLTKQFNDKVGEEMSLNDIIIMQLDEPKQKNCVY